MDAALSLTNSFGVSFGASLSALGAILEIEGIWLEKLAKLPFKSHR